MSDLSTRKYEELYTKLSEEVGDVDWPAIKGHYGRETVFLVAPGLDLIDVGVHVALDDKTAVKDWLENGQLRRPTEEMVARWVEDDTQFNCIIVQPFVFAQTISQA